MTSLRIITAKIYGLAEKSAAEAADFALSTTDRSSNRRAYELAGLSAEEPCYTRPPDYFDYHHRRASPMTVVSLTHWSLDILARCVRALDYYDRRRSYKRRAGPAEWTVCSPASQAHSRTNENYDQAESIYRASWTRARASWLGRL